MNWYEQIKAENEHRYQSLCRQVRLTSMRYEVAKADPEQRETAMDLHWQLEALKEKRDELAQILKAA